MSAPVSVQIFGLKNSPATRAAERFFKERRVQIHMVDLKMKPMSPGEIKRFTDKFGLRALCDTAKIERDPRLLRLPLVRGSNKFAVGQDEDAWQSML